MTGACWAPANDQKNATVPVFNAMCERSNIAATSQQETKQFCYFFLYFIVVAANWYLVTFLFRKSRGKISRKFATSPDILVAKGKN